MAFFLPRSGFVQQEIMDYIEINRQAIESKKHAQDIKKYLEQSNNRFIPELVLEARVPVNLKDAGAFIDGGDL